MEIGASFQTISEGEDWSAIFEAGRGGGRGQRTTSKGELKSLSGEGRRGGRPLDSFFE